MARTVPAVTELTSEWREGDPKQATAGEATAEGDSDRRAPPGGGTPPVEEAGLGQAPRFLCFRLLVPEMDRRHRRALLTHVGARPPLLKSQVCTTAVPSSLKSPLPLCPAAPPGRPAALQTTPSAALPAQGRAPPAPTRAFCTRSSRGAEASSRCAPASFLASLIARGDLAGGLLPLPARPHALSVEL